MRGLNSWNYQLLMGGLLSYTVSYRALNLLTVAVVRFKDKMTEIRLPRSGTC